jgi:rubredoxin
MPEPQARADPSLLPIERPRCPKCQAGRMMLARITLGPNHSDMRTFECPKCDYVHRVVVEDPLKSARTGWANSYLYSPK